MTTPLADWAQRLQAIAQSGLAYQPHAFDRLRYEDVLAIAIEMMTAQFPDIDPAEMRRVYLEQEGHATPKVDVRGAVFRDGRLLLVQERMDGDRWTLPGGWADIGESAGDSAAREIWEETGWRARPVKLMAAFDRNKHDHPPFVFHAYKLFFLCELTSGIREPDPRNVETGDADWFSEDAIDGLALSVGRVTPAQLHRFFEHARQPAIPTDFD